MYFKDFDKWNIVKKQVHTDERKVSIRAGEIRWISCGVNVGSEIDGKGESFTRPALIVHVVGSVLALVLPLSTKIKEVAGYIPFEFQGKQTSICVHQMRIVSQRRVLARKGRISENRLKRIKSEVRRFFDL
ncbi:MAG: type II toxin-antitoxin system PemK/MazF family toxin [Candidatus Taylorbacteria bacterium]